MSIARCCGADINIGAVTGEIAAQTPLEFDLILYASVSYCYPIVADIDAITQAMPSRSPFSYEILTSS